MSSLLYFWYFLMNVAYLEYILILKFNINKKLKIMDMNMKFMKYKNYTSLHEMKYILWIIWNAWNNSYTILSNNYLVISGLCRLIFSIWLTSYILISLRSDSISAARYIFIGQTTIVLIYDVTVYKSKILWRHVDWSNSTGSGNVKK